MDERLAHWVLVDGKFIVSTEWERLTGYKARDIFPPMLPKDLDIRISLDNFIARWGQLVDPGDRQKATQAVENFVLYCDESSYFNIYYRLLCADDSIKLVRSYGQSVWDDDQLQKIITVVEEVPYTEQPEAAVAISENVEHIAIAEKEIKTLTSRLKELRTLWPLLLALFVGFNDRLESIKNEIGRTWHLLTTPIEVIDLPLVEEFLPNTVTAEGLEAAQELIIATAPTSVLRAEIVAYEPGQFPTRYKAIISLVYGDQAMEASTDTRVQKVASLASAGARRDSHLSRQPFEYQIDDGYRYSAPFWMFRADGQPQLLYVELTAKDYTHSADIATAAQELAAKLSETLTGP